MLRMIATSLLLASCLALGGCPQAPETPAETPEVEAPAAPVAAGSLTLAVNGGEAQTLPASECVMNSGANGVVRAGDGAYELNWADGAFRFTGNTAQGVYNGDVSGAVDGAVITFEGTNNGVTVSGWATCG